MQKNLKHFLWQRMVGVITVMCMVSAILPVTVGAVDSAGSIGESITWEIKGNVLTINGSGALSAFDEGWKSYTDNINEINVGDGVTELGSGVFGEFKNLNKADIAYSVVKIDGNAFPNTEFELYGWKNHSTGAFAKEHSNAKLKLKELRVLCIGNSHTNDYMTWVLNSPGGVRDDLINGGLKTTINVEKIYVGSRRLYEDGKVYNKEGMNLTPTGSHYKASQNPDDTYYSLYTEAFKKTYDLVIAQDYQESVNVTKTYGGAGFADDMKIVVKWLKEKAPGADIAWFADWVDKNVNGESDEEINKGYEQSVAAMNAVNALPEGEKPDFIIPASTILQNARASYFGKTKNAKDAMINWEGIYTGFDIGKLDSYTILERDKTHMSLELGRHMMSCAVMYKLYDQYKNNLITSDGFDFLNSLKTAPVFRQRGKDDLKDKVCEWQGEYTTEVWNVIKEVCRNTVAKQYEVTASEYTADPFDEMYGKSEEVIKGVSLPDEINEATLVSAFKSDKVINELNNIKGLEGITADDIVIKYIAPVNGTEQVPNGKNGSYSVGIKCHYGYSYSPENVLSEVITAKTYNNDDISVRPIKSEISSDGKVTFNGIIKGNYTDTTSVFAASYSDEILNKFNKAEIDSSEENKGKFNLEIDGGYSKKMFVWDGMSPVQNCWEFSEKKTKTENKANGVIVSWDSVDGANSYDVYRDGILIANGIEQTTYSDKFFDTIEGMLGEKYNNTSNPSSAANNYDVRKGEADKDYNYTVVSDNNKVLQSAIGRADAENKIAYITFNASKPDSVKTIADVNAGSKGIRLVGTDAHMQTESNPSSLETMRRAARDIKTSVGENGYLKLEKTNYSSAMLFHNTAYNKGGIIDSAIGLGRANARTGLHLGNMITGEKAYKYKTDSDGYLLNAEGNRVTSISEAAFSTEAETWVPKPDVTSDQVFTRVVADAPYAVVDKFKNADVKNYVFLMNAKFDRTNIWNTPVVNDGSAYTNAKAKSGVTVIETNGEMTNSNNSAYQFSANGYINDYYTYRFEAEAVFNQGSGEKLFGENKISGLIGPSDDEFSQRDFNSDEWNIRFTSASVANHYWIHSFAVILADEYIK